MFNLVLLQYLYKTMPVWGDTTWHGMRIWCNVELGTAAVLSFHCVTYNTNTNETQVGPCFYNCENTAKKTMYDRIYHPLPRNPVTDLNDYMCGRFNRIGILCGECYLFISHPPRFSIPLTSQLHPIAPHPLLSPTCTFHFIS